MPNGYNNVPLEIVALGNVVLQGLDGGTVRDPDRCLLYRKHVCTVDCHKHAQS